MIGKVPKAGRGFKGLISYLLHGQRETANNPSRIAWTVARNLISDDPTLAPKLMRMTAAHNSRVKSPVYHYVISWHKNENPSDELMLKVADTTCNDLDLADYQRLYIAHTDTKHKHLHIVVNRVHPETHKAWNRRQDWVTIEQSLKRQADDNGLQFVPGRHNSPDKMKHRAKRAPDASYQKARKEGRGEPRRQWAPDRIALERQRLLAHFDVARSWQDLHTRLAQFDITLERKGQGLVLADHAGEMKLSDLAKGIRLASLEQKFAQPWDRAAAIPTPTLDHQPRPIDEPTLSADPPHQPTITKPAQRWSNDRINRERTRLAPAFNKARDWIDLATRLHPLGIAIARRDDTIVLKDSTGEASLNDFGLTPDRLTAHFDNPTPQRPFRPRWSYDRVQNELPALRTILNTAHSMPHLVQALNARGMTLDRRDNTLFLVDDHGELPLSALGTSLRQLESHFNDPTIPALFRDRWNDTRIALERARLPAIFKAALNWSDLETRLAALDINIERKGQGIVLYDHAGEMKLSDLGKDFRLAKLEQQFAHAPDPEPQRAIPPKPALSRTTSQPTPDRRQDTTDQPSGEPTRQLPPTPAQQARADLAAAAEATDFAFDLYRMGLINGKQLAASVASRQRAKEAADQHKSFNDKIADDVREALNPKSPTLAPQPEPPAPRQPNKRRRDRGRGR